MSRTSELSLAIHGLDLHAKDVFSPDVSHGCMLCHRESVSYCMSRLAALICCRYITHTAHFANGGNRWGTVMKKRRKQIFFILTLLERFVRPSLCRPLGLVFAHSTATHIVPGEDLILCLLRRVHSHNIWLGSEVLSGASGLQLIAGGQCW